MAVLSKNTTYHQMMDLVRMKLRIYDDPMFSDAFFIRKINDVVSNFYAKQFGRDFYQQRTIYSLSGSSNPYHVDLSSTLPFPYKIIDVVYKGSGRTSIKQVSQVKLEEELQLTSINANSIFCSIGGDSIDISFGSSITVVASDSIEVLYQRQPTLVTTIRPAGKGFTVDTNETLPTNLVEGYKLSDTTGFFNGLDMTNVGGVPFVSGGKLNNAASFVASSDGVYLSRSGASITTVNNNFTVCGWVNLASALLKGVFVYIGNRASNGWGFGVGLGDLNTNGNNLIEVHANGILRMNNLGANIGTGAHFILMERDAGTIRGYIDNVVCPNTVSGIPSVPTINTFIGAVGAPNEPVISSRVPTALEDNFVIWNKVLSTTEKSNMWNGGSGNPMITIPEVYIDVLDSDIPFIQEMLIQSIGV